MFSIFKQMAARELTCAVHVAAVYLRGARTDKNSFKSPAAEMQTSRPVSSNGGVRSVRKDLDGAASLQTNRTNQGSV